ncbi:hypothetical protein FRC11_013147 [Ceratobasidium sp. 423]|nr:hypothetical protein FRC11_013147 [Ceratobasidium sp. 423]
MTTQDKKAAVNVRIEAPDKIVFEGVIKTEGRDITTLSGGTHNCGGTSGTCTTTLADAADKAKFKWDATWSDSIKDFFIISIDGFSNTNSQWWGLFKNGVFSKVGGCQNTVKEGDKVVWAFVPSDARPLLKLKGPTTAKVNAEVEFCVSNSKTGAPISEASIDVAGHPDWTATTGSNGCAKVTFKSAGAMKVTATKNDCVTSFEHDIKVE